MDKNCHPKSVWAEHCKPRGLDHGKTKALHMMAQNPYEIDVFYLMVSITLIVLGARVLFIN